MSKHLSISFLQIYLDSLNIKHLYDQLRKSIFVDDISLFDIPFCDSPEGLWYSYDITCLLKQYRIRADGIMFVLPQKDLIVKSNIRYSAFDGNILNAVMYLRDHVAINLDRDISLNLLLKRLQKFSIEDELCGNDFVIARHNQLYFPSKVLHVDYDNKIITFPLISEFNLKFYEV